MPTSRFNPGPLPADIRTTVTALGIKIDHVSKDELYALCPAHDDRHAKNWSINERTGAHKCFACGFSGRFVDLVKFMRGKDREDAKEWVRKMGGASYARRKLRSEVVLELPAPREVTEADLFVFNSPPKWAMEEKGVNRWACENYGVLWDKNTNSWVFPIRDPFTNELRGWQKKNKRYFENYPKHMTKSDCIFGSHLLEEVSDDTPLVVLESPIDPVYLWTCGLELGVSTLGASVSRQQVKFLSESGRKIIWALDNDQAGWRMSEKIIEEFRGKFPMEFYDYGDSKAKDPGEQSFDAIQWGIDNATSPIVTRFA